MTYDIKNDMIILAGLLCTCFFTCQLQPNSENAPTQATEITYTVPDAYTGFDSALSCAYEYSDSVNRVVSAAIAAAKRDRVPIIFETRKDTIKSTGHPFGGYRHK